MKFTVLTLFPEIIDAYFASSIMARALERGIIGYRALNIRDFALDRHKSCDDAPYGGGPGMLMLAEPLRAALEAAGNPPQASGTSGVVPSGAEPRRTVIYLSPSGRPFDQERARKLAALEELILICGRYEGIDQRIIDAYVDEELSVGDYVLSSGEVAALAVIDSVYRLVDRVITPESLEEESFSGGLLEYPQYTRPEILDILKFQQVEAKVTQVETRVPEVLLSGHHENIRRWRLKKRVEKTLAVRPDLIDRGLREGRFDAETVKFIEEGRDERDKSD
ncbi:MAG: tRNA (guanosine(37)-N1)-methyltransferase TrmD [Treponema sp.]|jgi:tRNA (guanine37-N1)-methyltransferase|nr:tRNA (guanosine(37)-N1)-methyltransferase TrmD [Treponema sp.]